MKITKGLNVPIAGAPVSVFNPEDAPQPPQSIAVLGRDFHDLRPAMQVEVGDKVSQGQILFIDRKQSGINFTAPASGQVTAINRGEKRVLNSVVIELDDSIAPIDFGGHDNPEALDAEAIRQTLLDSGQWVAFRTRPYSKIPDCDSTPSSIFVTAMDTLPLSAKPEMIIERDPAAFKLGVELLAKLAPKVFVCHETGVDLPRAESDNVGYHDFSGVHPAGLVGTHIHFLDPVDEAKSVWSINYQEVMAIARLFTTGHISNERVISLSGPAAKNPRLVQTQLGADLNQLTEGEMSTENCRVISGAPLSGFAAHGDLAFLGRYNHQVSILEDGEPRKFLHWLNPLLKQFSTRKVFLKPTPKSGEFSMSTTQNGSRRAMVPLGSYESVVPLDILPTQLLRALLVRDTESAQKLGALELDEDDLALCTFVCHSKYEYGRALRETLRLIEKGE